MTGEDYVSFETAKLLKEKRFDWECRAFYVKSKECGIELFPSDRSHNYNDDVYPRISAPTHQMAMKWLRETHNLFVFPFPQMNTNKFWVEIFQLSDSQEWVNLYCESIELQDYQAQEEACEAGIKYCLENLI